LSLSSIILCSSGPATARPLGLAIPAHLKDTAIGCRYANIYHHNRAKLIKDILSRQTPGTGTKFLPQGNHQTISQKSHKYMRLYPVLELMINRTNGKVAL
jgi:hypothetical protein